MSKNPQHDCVKTRGGGQGPFTQCVKKHPIWQRMASLIVIVVVIAIISHIVAVTAILDISPDCSKLFQLNFSSLSLFVSDVITLLLAKTF